ncbi:MAG: TAXI family TRAP transporter solute-binding subunit, partial [Sphaerochaetaceae bacterium]|nr:TAXI family TRAP transporter solute-binding subunit [Sphaerochaetaceae bacterium]
MKKMLMILLIASLATVVFAGAQAEATAEVPKFIEVGTAGTGGAYYPIGIAMAEILTAKLPTQATAQVTGGAVENIRL